MTRRLCLLEDDDPEPGSIDEDLLEQMSAMLFFNKRWHARAHNCTRFASAATLLVAITSAIDLRDEEKTK